MQDYIKIIIGAAIAIIVIFVLGYLKAPPDTAYIISGLGKKRILIGKAGWRVPFFERVDKLSLRVMQVDVKTSEAVPTNEFINVNVDGVANIKISFFLQLSSSPLSLCVCMCECVCVFHIFFIHSSVDGHLGCIHVLAIVNSATVNIGVNGSF